MYMGYVESQRLANIFDALGFDWQSIVAHLIALIILTVGLYLLLFKPVKKMIKERQEKIRKIEQENNDLNEEVKSMKSSTEVVLNEAKKQASVIHDNAVRVANQKADEIVSSARKEAKDLVERTEREMEEERTKLQSEIKKQISDVSIAVAEKVLARDLTPQDNKKLIEDCIEQWSEEE